MEISNILHFYLILALIDEDLTYNSLYRCQSFS